MKPQPADGLADDGWKAPKTDRGPATAGTTITLHVPFRIVKRGGRKEIVLPPDTTPQRKTDDTLVKALARAFRWKRMLESGEFATIAELAAKEGIAVSYMTRVLRLALLSPRLVEVIVEGRHPTDLSLAALLKSFPGEWDAQFPQMSMVP